MTIFAEADLVGSVTDVAVTVTLPPVGIAAGAVYVVPTPVAVVVELNEPHAVVPHVTVHVTSGFAETSFAIFAMREDCPLICRDAGGERMLTEIGIGGTIVICAETDLLLSATEVAVTVTVVPAGIAEGAVYVVAAASALGPKVPHAPGLPQVTAHVTALLPPVMGLANVAAAVSDAEAFTASDVGGGATKMTPVGPGGAGGGGSDGLCEPPQPASATIASKPNHPATFVGSAALGGLISRSIFCLIHSIRHSVNNAG
jgi:hypothetical protein